MGLLDAPFINKESIGSKLRRLSRLADINNPTINPYWSLPPAWAATTAYYQGQVVSLSGYWWVCAVDGTSGSSFTPTANIGNVQTDGSTQWTFFGTPSITSSDANAPTVTLSATSGIPSGLTSFCSPISAANSFRLTGGYFGTPASNFAQILTFASASGVNDSQSGRITFMTDAPKFAINIGSGSFAIQISVDGRMLSPSAIAPQANGTGNRWITVDFSATTGKQIRRVTIEGLRNRWYFGGIAVDNLSQVWRASYQDTVSAVVIGDSIIRGSSYGPHAFGMPSQRIAHAMGWDNVWNMSTGGTGWLNPNGSNYTFVQRITEALTRTPDIWIFAGSINDTGYTQAQITTAVTSALTAIREGGSNAPIAIFGTWTNNMTTVTSSQAQIESAIQSAVTSFNDAKVFFIPIRNDAILPWITGAWNNSANTSSTNATLYISSDGIHPSDLGSVYFANRMILALKNNVLPNIK